MTALAPWNTDIKAAPHGRYEIKQRREGVDVRVFVPQRVILATKCGKVTRSHYQPEVKRWEMLADGEMPVAWTHYEPGRPLPDYPHSLLSAPGAMNRPDVGPPPPASGHQSNSLLPPIRQAASTPEAANPHVSGEPYRADAGLNIVMTHQDIRA